MADPQHFPYTTSYGTPDKFLGQPFYFENENTLIVNNVPYTKIDQGYACGGKQGPPGNAVTIFGGRGGGAVLMSHPPYCNICPTCWHKCGKKRCPDWAHCGEVISNGYGFIVTFPSMGWLWTCMSKIAYQSTTFPI